MQRGHNREPVFFQDQDCLEYLKILKRTSEACHCAIHAYVLMMNHVHLLDTPMKLHSVSKMMQALGRRYVRYINKAYRRTAILWE